LNNILSFNFFQFPKEIRTEIESFLEQACGLKLNVNSILIIHLSSKWFHSSQIALVTKTCYALVSQIFEQYNKILDQMHLYFQNGHKEHQMGLV